MAQVHIKAAVTGIAFGLGFEEGTNVITSKVSTSRKIKKKDLRGIQGGYKSIVSFGEMVECSVDAALVGAAAALDTYGFVLADTYIMLNDPFTVGISMFVESVTLNEKNDDFKRISAKIVGSVNLGTV